MFGILHIVNSTNVIIQGVLVARFLYAILSSLCISVAIGNGAVKVVAVGNCCIYKICYFCGFVIYNRFQAIVTDYPISYHGPELIYSLSLLFFLPPLCRVFTIIYLKHTIFLG